MKKTIIILTLLALIVGSCGQTKKDEEVEEQGAIEKTDDFVYVSDSIEINKSVTYCFNASIPVFDFITDKSLLASIYAPIFNSITDQSPESISAPTQISMADYSKNGLHKALLELKERCFPNWVEDDDWDEDDSEYEQKYNYEDKFDMNVFWRNDNFLTVTYTVYNYTGGAHGNYSETYSTFDLNNNTAVLLKNVIKNPEEKAWNRILKECLLADVKYEDIEDMLLVDAIFPNDSFYFDNEGITFVYSPYEIAAYAAGVIYLRVPFKDIEELLMPDFAKLVL